MKKQVLILVCFLVVLSGIGIVNAETVSGTLGSEGITSYNYETLRSTSSGGQSFKVLFLKNIESIPSPTAFIHFDQPGYLPSYSNASAYSGLINFTLTIDGDVRATGQFGYQRSFSGSTEIPGFRYLLFDTWNNTGLSGDKTGSLNWDDGELGQVISNGEVGPVTSAPTGYMAFGGITIAGYQTLNMDITFWNEYAATSPQGLGIAGVITKTVSGTPYSSRAYIINATSGSVLTSELSTNTNNWNFSVVSQTVKISILSSTGQWFNTSNLFAPAVTPTPTATPTTAPTIAPGFVRTSVETIDGTTGNTIHGSNIFLYDVEGSTWSNSSSDADGIHYIDTLPYHTINAYGTFTVFAGEYTDASALGLPTGYYGGFTYYLSMFPPALSPGEGNVNLYVTVLDADSYDIIRDASVQVRLPTGAVQGGSTGSSGTEIFVVPNSTVINIAAAKAGYVGSNTVVNSGAGTTASATVYLHKAVITTTPTSTIPPGGVTPAVTADPNDPSITGSTNAKGQEMLNWLAMNGMDLVQLCFLVTVMALLGIKFGK